MSVGYVCAGGGRKGGFQVGVILALAKHGIRPDLFHGISVGSLNAIAYGYAGSHENAPKALLDQWMSIKGSSDIVKKNILGIISGTASGVYSTKPMKKRIDKVMEGKLVPNLKLCVGYTELVSRELRYSYNRDKNFREHVHASTLIPFAMEPIVRKVRVGDEERDEVLADGGIRDLVPLGRVIRDGADDIYVMHTQPLDPSKHEKWELPKWPFKLVKYGLRAVDAMQTEVFKNDIKLCRARNIQDGTFKKVSLKVFAPDFDLGDALDFDPKKIRRDIAHGMEVAQRVMRTGK